MEYDYNSLLLDISYLAKNNTNIGIFSIGESVLERKIYCISCGNGKKKLFINGAHHGLEYITSAFIMQFIKEYLYCYEHNKEMFGYPIVDFFNNVTIYFVPMVNPDGVEIAVNGLDINNPQTADIISLVGICDFKKEWQANANGVDINHNYNADWKKINPLPCPTRYSGPYPQSEPETKAIVEFIEAEQFDMMLAFHSQGEEIYYDFNDIVPKKSKIIAKEMELVSGYNLAKPEKLASFGGLKDYFIKKYNKPAFTIEIGKGKNPILLEKLEEIYPKCAKIILTAIKNMRDL